MLFTDISATSAMMFTLARENVTSLSVNNYEHLGRSILTEKPLKHNEKDTTAVRKHCRQQNHPTDSFCFLRIKRITCYFKI